MTTTPFDIDWEALSPSGGAPSEPPLPPTPSGPERRPHRTLTAAALVVAGAVIGGVTAHTLTPGSTNSASGPTNSAARTAPVQPNPVVPPQSGGGTDNSGAGPANAAALASKIDPAIVDINTKLGFQNGAAAGTGIVLTSTGEVLTNNHVISGATSITATDVGNGKTYTATVVGYDKSHDIAVLQLQGASRLTTATTSTAAAQAGDGVVGVGNAGGKGGTPSYAAGVVTATDQTITASDGSDGTSEQLTGLLQTNAAIEPGDSGGPLVNTNGEVIGIDTAASAGFRLSQTSEAYAIPIQTALGIAHQIESGQASDSVHIGATAMLGVSVQADTAGGGGPSSGAVIAGVVQGGPAAAAGLTGGDTIVAVAGHSIRSPDDLSSVILTLRPGDSVSVHYLGADGSAHSTNVKLGSGPAQ